MSNKQFYSFCFPLSKFLEYSVWTNGTKFLEPTFWSVELRKMDISDTFYFTSLIEAP
jgi:hypothetical protein